MTMPTITSSRRLYRAPKKSAAMTIMYRGLVDWRTMALALVVSLLAKTKRSMVPISPRPLSHTRGFFRARRQPVHRI